MKKIIIGAILLLSGDLTFAQVKWGVKAGINRNTISKSSVNPDPEALVGINTGMMAFIPIDKKLLIRAEIQYTSKGYKIPPATINTVNSSILLGRRSIGLYYISVPVLLSYKLSKKVNVLAGPELGFLLKAEETGNFQKRDRTRSFEKRNLSIDMGIAYNITKNVGVELRYCHGLINLQEYFVPVGSGNSGLIENFNQTRTMQAGFFYRFSKK